LSSRRDPRDDAVLIRAHVAGDPDAFAEIVRRHRDRLWAVALRTLGDREDAADAVQDALVSAYRAADRFRGDAAVTTWLHRIVVNACLDRARRRRAHPTVPLPETDTLRLAGSSPIAPGPDPDVSVAIEQALAQLPVEQRAAIVLLDVEGYSVAEIAQLLGVAEGTVKSRCARGRARLAVLLGHLRTAEPDRSGPTSPTPMVGPAGGRVDGNPAAPGGVGSPSTGGQGGTW
jgi:RNA polymerase sigma-70 factor, ECF subfamily